MSTLKVNTITNTSGNPDVANMGKIVQVVQNFSNGVTSANIVINYLDSPADSVTQYKVRWKSYGSQILLLNRAYDDANNSGYTRTTSSITLYEIAA